MAIIPDLRRRQKALDRTIEKYGQANFSLGSADCVQLARFHLKAMGVKKLPVPAKYTNTMGARRALKAVGVRNIEQLLDKFLERITPAAMLPGDVAMLPSEPGEEASEIGTLAICLGRKVLSWHPDYPTPVVMEVAVVKAAWRA